MAEYTKKFINAIKIEEHKFEDGGYSLRIGLDRNAFIKQMEEANFQNESNWFNFTISKMKEPKTVKGRVVTHYAFYTIKEEDALPPLEKPF